MKYERHGERVQFRFMSGERLVAPLTAWLTDSHMGYATMTGLGAVSGATVSYWNAETRQYEQHELAEQMEVVSLIGNVTLKDDQPFLHIHVTLGRRDLSIIGGHLNDLSVHPNLEIWMRPEAIKVRRTLDEASGLYVMDLTRDG